MDKRELRIVELAALEVREDDGGSPEITGHAAVFNKLSLDLGGFKEKIEPGAFRETLDEDVWALFNHDPNFILGRTAAETLEIAEDKKGLRFKIYPPNTAQAESVLVSIRRGDVTGASFGFSTIEDEWEIKDKGPDIRTLLKVRLFDIGPVVRPAYPQTDVAARAHEAAVVAARPDPRELVAARAHEAAVVAARPDPRELAAYFENKKKYLDLIEKRR